MSPSEIAVYASGAGFSGSALPIAVAIAMAESSGNPQAHNPRPPDDSYGLWQINMYGSLGPARRAQFGLSSNSDLFDPATNAAAAFAISGGGASFTPWSTYTNGAYRRYLSSTIDGGTGASEGSSPGSQLMTEGGLTPLGWVALVVVAFMILR